jgi:chemotaxis protein MotA
MGATLGGFMMAGGQPLVLMHMSEFVVIGGVSVGVVVISSPMETIKAIGHKTVAALKGGGGKKSDYVDLLKVMYETFVLARRNGLIALEDHVMEPSNSPMFKKYPSFLHDKERVNFFCNGLRPLIDGRIKPEQLEGLMQSELNAKEEEGDAPVHILQLIGDSLPGIGIIAAVLGIINTMSAIAEGPAAVGEHVASALTGTFLGILGAYGFVNPLTIRIKCNNAADIQYYSSIVKGLSCFANGMAPVMAVEVARRCLDPAIQPEAEELEKMLKALTAGGGK